LMSCGTDFWRMELNYECRKLRKIPRNFPLEHEQVRQGHEMPAMRTADRGARLRDKRSPRRILLHQLRLWYSGMRLSCHLFGCQCDCYASTCHRCGADPYQDFIEYGKLDWLTNLWRSVKEFTWPRCYHCGKRLLWGRRVERNFCSNECHDRWLPF